MKALIVPVLAVAAIALCTSAMPADKPGDPGEPDRISALHASLRAYQGGVITLKDPESDMFFYVESNGRRLVAFDAAGKIAWITDILPLDKELDGKMIGQPVVRHLRIENKRLVATYAKGGNAFVDIPTGKIVDNIVR